VVIFFDIDDTLIDSESAHTESIRSIWEINGFPPLSEQSVQEWSTINNKYFELYFENKITLEQQRTYRIIEFWKSHGKNISEEEAYELYQHYHYIFLNSCRVFSDTIDTLDELKDFKLAIISNGTPSDQFFKLELNNIAHFFDPIIISEEIGISKPSKEIFLCASQKVQKSPSDCIHVGDSYKIDYEGSLNAGMSGILLDRKLAFKDLNYKIISLKELKNKLLQTSFKHHR